MKNVIYGILPENLQTEYLDIVKMNEENSIMLKETNKIDKELNLRRDIMWSDIRSYFKIPFKSDDYFSLKLDSHGNLISFTKKESMLNEALDRIEEAKKNIPTGWSGKVVINANTQEEIDIATMAGVSYFDSSGNVIDTELDEDFKYSSPLENTNIKSVIYH